MFFSKKEIFTIFFCLHLLKSIVNSPFGCSYNNIETNLLQTFSNSDQREITNSMNYINFEGHIQLTDVSNLENLYACIIKDKVISFDYTRKSPTHRKIYPIHLTIRDGYWYCTGLDIDKSAYRTFRCDLKKTL
ncbi:helix-turn-helix transcriptional regulator [Enterococcus wangshanyuanii]|uniref:WYL domain-containing protein n=1 Tax=Enterococcus wangshanyuanii TaxID=2005703 RepID=A0ABQ1PSQ0_9ENTE|nr:hypothetical protein GCM10011573_35680 [Enterococcus wangshanyuanii]